METNERNTVIYSMGDCIAAPLGFGSEMVYNAVAEGNSAARLHEGTFGLPEPFFGSLFEREWIDETFALSCPADNTRYTPFEKIAIIATGIQNLQADNTLTDTAIYTLNGVKVGRMQGAGVYIVKETYADNSVKTRKVLWK